MRTATALTVVLVGVVVLDAPAGDIKPLTPVEAIKKVNEKVIVQMLVKATKNRLEKRGEIYLDSEEDFRDEKNLGVVVTKTGAAKFKKAGVDDPAAHFKNKTIRVKGTVVIKEKRPRIEVDDPKQIQIVREETVKTFTFKKTKQADLAIHVHFPPDWKKEDRRPAIVFFFGGGFQFGSVRQFEPQAAYFASRGMVAARADYRVKSRHKVEPDACVEDAKSAVRWLRQNAARLGMDSNRLVACGSSSGGYLAACTACPGLEPEGEDLKISSRPNAMILVNPFLPFVKEKANWKIVPTLHLTKDTPPTLILFGTKDALLPRGNEFMTKSKEVGHKAEMYLAEGVGHGFAGRSPWREKALQREDEFLAVQGYLKGKPTIKMPDAKDSRPKPQPKQ